eukprot:3926682-Rhodomonas_salina.1
MALAALRRCRGWCQERREWRPRRVRVARPFYGPKAAVYGCGAAVYMDVVLLFMGALCMVSLPKGPDRVQSLCL